MSIILEISFLVYPDQNGEWITFITRHRHWVSNHHFRINLGPINRMFSLCDWAQKQSEDGLFAVGILQMSILSITFVMSWAYEVLHKYLSMPKLRILSCSGQKGTRITSLVGISEILVDWRWFRVNHVGNFISCVSGSERRVNNFHHATQTLSIKSSFPDQFRSNQLNVFFVRLSSETVRRLIVCCRNFANVDIKHHFLCHVHRRH